MYEYGKDFTAENLDDFLQKVQERKECNGGQEKSERTLFEQEEKKESIDQDFI